MLLPRQPAGADPRDRQDQAARRGHGAARRRQQGRAGNRHRRGAARGRPRSRLARPDRALAQRRRARAARVPARARAQRNAVLGESIQEAAQGVHGGLRRRHRPRSGRHPRRREPGVGRLARPPERRSAARRAAHGSRSTAASKAALKGALVACGRGPVERRVDQSRRHDGAPARSCRSSSSSRRRRSTATRPSSSAFRARASKRASPRSSSSKPCTRIPTTGFYHRRRFLEVLTDRLDAKRQPRRARARVHPARQVPRARGADRAARDRGRPGADRRAAARADAAARSLRAASAARCSRCSSSAARCATSRPGRRTRSRASPGRIFESAHNTLSVTCTIGLAEVGPTTERLDALIAQARRSNQAGRDQGGNRVVLQQTSDESTRVQRFDEIWVQQIKTALMENRFRLAHLPIASLERRAARRCTTPCCA